MFFIFRGFSVVSFIRSVHCRDLLARRRVIGRCRGRCWSYLTSWTASALIVTSRSEAREVVLVTFSCVI